MTRYNSTKRFTQQKPITPPVKKSRKRGSFLPALLAAPFLLFFAFLFTKPDLGADIPFSTVLFSAEGELMGAKVAADQQWRFPPATAIPDKFLTALIAYEDQRFYRHLGVDPWALLRASYRNIRAGKVVSGGSTLVMQTVRLLRANPPRTFSEKLIEIGLALRLEAQLRKPEILNLYATHAPFGGNVVGLEAASWRYFGRAPERLSWAEAATLAVLPNAPGLIHPGRSRAQLQQKRDYLLRKLHDLKQIDALDLRLALAEPLPNAPLPFPRLAPHLLHDSALIGTRIESTLQLNLQEKAEALMRWQGKVLREANVPNAAFLVVDNRTKAVIAYVGNTAPDEKNGPVLDQGHAIDLVHRPRSSGSILKPLLYALMLEKGEILPTRLVADVPTQINGFVPENFDKNYRGAVPANEALALSLNIPAVRLLREHGLETFYLQLKHMGMSTLFRRAEDYGLTLILGGAEAKLYEIAAIYANLASIAQSFEPQPLYQTITHVKSGPPPQSVKAEYGPGAAFLTLEAMAEVNRPGLEAHWKSFSSSRKVAWKTGTSFGLRDAWAVAVTPEFTVAVWAGNAHGDGIAGLSGTQTAAPLLFEVLNLLPETGWFQAPQHDLKSIEICKNDGYLPRNGCETATTLAPKHSHFDQGSAWHQPLWLDTKTSFKVHAGCRSANERETSSWFQLPPGMEFYYRRYQPAYKRAPDWSPDCRPTQGSEQVMEVLYPEAGARIYLPTEIGGQIQTLVAHAVHRDPKAVLYWHLDETFLGSTESFHQINIQAGYGPHVLTLVDQSGARVSRKFMIKSP